jgi:uncharacterized protein (TIGR02452 family)
MEFDYIKWIKAFQAAALTKDRNSLHQLRISIYKGTMKFVQSGGYTVDDGRHIVIDNRCIVSEYFRKPDKLSSTVSHDTQFSVINADCLEVAQLLHNSGYSPCVLNLASRQNPGGGVLNGAGAQEENLFRRTNLFMSLYRYAQYATGYGLTKDQDSYPLDRNTGGIYSDNITVFRGSEKNGYCLLKQPFRLSFVTVPALNHPELIERDNRYYIVDNLVKATKEKMRTILRIAGKYEKDCLVLGAFGCGAFCNPPHHIAMLFREVFMESEFCQAFRNVVFAILDDHNSGHQHNPDGNALPFFEVFDEIIPI